MYYKIFLDTNSYEAAGFNFGNAFFTQLKAYAQKGILNLQTNHVVDGEVRNHICNKIPESIEKIRNVIRKEKNLAGFRNQDLEPYDDKFSCLMIPENDIWVEDALRRYDDLQSDLGTEFLTINGIDLDGMLDDYFEQRPPFEIKKPSEFKDAILLRSVVKEIERLSTKNKEGGSDDHDNLVFKQQISTPWSTDEIKEDLTYCIVSDDVGVRKALEGITDQRPNEDIKVFDNLSGLLGFLSRKDELANKFNRLMENGYAFNDIKEAIRTTLECASIEVEGYEWLLEEIEICDIELIEYKSDIISLQEFSDGSIIAKVAIDSEVLANVRFSFMNEDESCWDKEIKEYIWRTLEIAEAEYAINVKIVMDLDASEIGTQWDENNMEDILKKEVEIVDIPEMPSSITLYADNCIRVEIVDTRDV